MKNGYLIDFDMPYIQVLIQDLGLYIKKRSFVKKNGDEVIFYIKIRKK